MRPRAGTGIVMAGTGIVMTVLVYTAGCAGLPPTPSPVKLPTEAPLTASGLDHERADWPGEKWWTHYGDAVLDQLIDMALASSPTLATARARFDTAEQSVHTAAAAAGARVQASGDISRQRLSDNGFIPPQFLGFHWYNQGDLGLQASYTFDWWGKQRDAVEAAVDEAHAAQADRAAAALVLAGSVADTYFGWQSDQGRLTLAREREATVAREGSITAARIRAELESADEAHRADSNLAAVREKIAELQGSAQLRIVTLAALVGCAADQLPAMAVRPLPAVSKGLPDEVKIDLISRRADLTASRWRVESAEKNREAARAEFFPDVSINALIGVQSIDLGKLLEYKSRVPSATAAIHLPIFDGGSLKARYGASQAAIDAAVAGYQETLVGAARDVAMQATSRAQIAARRTQRMIEVEAAERLKSSAAARVRQGVTDSRTELAAADSWMEQRDSLLQLDSAAVSSDIGLQRALGGGYLRNEKQ